MKSLVFSTLAAATLLATTAFAGVDTGLSRGIESKVDAAHSKAAQAQAAFDAGDANGGCRALAGAARELDASINMSVSLIDGTTSRHIPEDHSMLDNMRTRLQAIVDERTVVQEQLEQRCQTAA